MVHGGGVVTVGVVVVAVVLGTVVVVVVVVVVVAVELVASGLTLPYDVGDVVGGGVVGVVDPPVVVVVVAGAVVVGAVVQPGGPVMTVPAPLPPLPTAIPVSGPSTAATSSAAVIGTRR